MKAMKTIILDLDKCEYIPPKFNGCLFFDRGFNCSRDGSSVYVPSYGVVLYGGVE